MHPHAHNLLPPEHQPAARRRRKAIRWALGTLAVLAVLLVAAGVVLAVPAIAAMRVIYDDAQAGKSDLDQAKAAAEKLDFATASSSLADASAQFKAGEDGIDALGLVAHLPVVASNVASVRGLLDGGRNTAEALHEAVDVGADLVAVLKTGAGSFSNPAQGISQDQRPVSQLSDADRRALLQKISEAPARLGVARDALDRAIASFDGIKPTPLTAGILVSVRPQVDRLRQLRGLLAQDLSVLAEIPKIIGYPKPKTYLFLLLNNTELRPGGGFIGTYGVVKLADGQLTSFFTDDVYNLDGPSEAWMTEKPPAPISQFLKTPAWFMRDGNWSPDFTVSALQVEHLYHLEKGPEASFDGVIGMTPTVIAKLLDITGPIKIGDTTFDSANVVDQLEYEVEKGFTQSGTPRDQRKDVVGALGQALVQKLMQLPVSQLADLAALAQDVIAEKQLMATFSDPEVQAYADAHDWSGRLPSPTGDALMIADANMAALKTDPVVERTISYAIRPDGDGYDATASMTYAHHGHFDWKTTRYRSYARFYVPLGSTLIKGDGMMVNDKIYDPKHTAGTIDVGTELGHTVFGAFVSVEPGETKTLTMTYRLPDAVARQIRAGQYRLDVTKELGTPADHLTLDLDFGKKLTRAVPPEASSEWGDTRYRLTTDARVNRTFTVGLAN